MMVEFFCKEKQGVVMRVFLFNDLAFIGINENGQLSPDSTWFANYHTFEFMEKDAKGNFVHNQEYLRKQVKLAFLNEIELQG